MQEGEVLRPSWSVNLQEQLQEDGAVGRDLIWEVMQVKSHRLGKLNHQRRKRLSDQVSEVHPLLDIPVGYLLSVGAYLGACISQNDSRL